MPSIILGNGEPALKIEGDTLRMDSLSVRIANEPEKKADLKITEGPSDDMRVSGLPQAIREVAEMAIVLELVKVDYTLPVGAFLTYKEGIEAWTPVGHEERFTKNTLVARSVSPTYIKVSGLIEVDAHKAGQDIVLNDWIIGKMVSPTIGLLTPWAMRPVGE